MLVEHHFSSSFAAKTEVVQRDIHYSIVLFDILCVEFHYEIPSLERRNKVAHSLSGTWVLEPSIRENSWNNEHKEQARTFRGLERTLASTKVTPMKINSY